MERIKAFHAAVNFLLAGALFLKPYLWFVGAFDMEATHRDGDGYITFSFKIAVDDSDDE